MSDQVVTLKIVVAARDAARLVPRILAIVGSGDCIVDTVASSNDTDPHWDEVRVSPWPVIERERAIIWVDEPKARLLGWARETTFLSDTPTGKPTDPVIPGLVCYANYGRQERPNTASGRYRRRAWYLTENDLRGWTDLPFEAVVPISISEGQYATRAIRATSPATWRGRHAAGIRPDRGE